MLEEIKKLINRYNPKSYASVLKNHPQVINWIINETEQYNPSSLNERLYILLVSPPSIKKCGQNPVFNSFQKGYREFCGPRSKCECSRIAHSNYLEQWHKNSTQEEKDQRVKRTKETCLKKYGVDNVAADPTIKQKIQTTSLLRYGAATPLESSVVQGKIKKTNLEKLGVEYPFQNHSIIKKSHNVQREKYGDDFMKVARNAFLEKNDQKNPFVIYQDNVQKSMEKHWRVTYPLQSNEIKERSISTLESNYGVKNPSQLHINKETYEILEDKSQFEELCKRRSLKELAEYLNVSEKIIWARHDRYGLDYYLRTARSQYEEEIAFWLDTLLVSYKRNFKIGEKTVDFLIENKIAVEFNGLYAHSEYSFYGQKLGVDKNYHSNKFKKCKEMGIQLFTVFEDEWNTKKETVKNRIKISLGIGEVGPPARKTVIHEIDYPTAYDFLEQYHLQGSTKGTVYLGAFYRNELIGVSVFLKRTEDCWELTRFVSDMLIHPGLFSKLLTYFEKKYPVEKIISFSDNRWSWGEVYRKNNFVIEKQLAPDYSVTDYKTREHKFNWRKSRIASRFGIDIRNKTELELIREVGWDRIWDCGKIRWTKGN